MASKTRADAMMKAVESGSVDSVIMNGDSAPALAVGNSTTPLAAKPPAN
jgi:ribosomal protein L12E/L44/L45/RPP1/RPP2